MFSHKLINLIARHDVFVEENKNNKTAINILGYLNCVGGVDQVTQLLVPNILFHIAPHRQRKCNTEKG